MKYTRLELHSGLAKNTLKNIITFFVLIPIIAIGIGKIVTRKLIVPNVNKIIQPVQYAVNSGSSVNKMDYYILQAGVFMNIENAQVLQRGINKTNINCFLVNDMDSFRVIVDVSDDKKSILNIEETLKKSGYNCIINNVTFNSDSNGTGIFKDISLVFDIINTEQDLITSNDNDKEILLKKIKDKKDKIQIIYENIKAQKKGIQASDNSLNNYSLIIKSVDEFTKYIESKKNSEAKGCMVNQLYCLKKIYDDNSNSK